MTVRIMPRFVFAIGFALSIAAAACARSDAPKPPAIRYGSNASAGGTFTHDGVSLYYETYGTGDPLLLIHGNGGSIADFAAQIPFFTPHYKVIAMDSRDQGKSGDSPDALTYEKMTDDLVALLDHLKTGPVNVVGWSDGGIEALLLGMRHPQQVKKIVAMAANLNPTESAVEADIIAAAKTMVSQMPAEARNTPQGRRDLKVINIVFDQPNIDPKELESITAPTLVLGSDHDIVREEHTVEIYRHLPNGRLGIFPGATHMIPFDDPATFNATVERFLNAPFVKIDRVTDTFNSLNKMRAAQAR
jgi:pimeloyl-ACP methyl ester carboxylesterase